MAFMFRVKSLAGFIFASLLFSGAAFGSQSLPAGLPSNPKELVRQTLANELDTNRQQHLMYRLTKTKPDGSEVRQMLETDTIVLGRLLLVNGKPLSRADAKKEDQRLQRLLNDPEQLAEKQKDQHDEDQRIRKMLRAMPDAFLYQYDGARPTAEGELVTLTFKPDPDFDPPSKETQVFRGMEGKMEIALPEHRLAEIDATLVKDVNFGWGFLGHLDKGGRFFVGQTRILNNYWVTNRMVLNFTGKVLMFKTLKIQLNQTTSDYQPIENMDVAKGISLLKKMDVEVARSNGTEREH